MIPLASFLVSATWKGSLLLAIALLATRIARGRVSSRWLHALLLIALVRLMIPVAPESRFSVFNFAPAERAILAEPAIAPLRVGPTMIVAPRPVILPDPPLAPRFTVLLALWAAGFGLVLLRALWQTRTLRRLLRDREPVTSPEILGLVDACRTELRIRRHVTVAETGAVSTPSLHGWLRPALLLPAGFLGTFSRQQLRFVLLHELGHLRRSDVLVHWLTTIAQALHWFNPLVHLAAARLAEERELACDALALEHLRSDERSAYGGTVLEVLDRLRQPSAVPGLVGMTTTHQQLKRRIKMIAGFRPQSRHSLLFAAVLTVFALMTLTDAVAGERVMHRKIAMKADSPEAQAVVKQLETPMHLQLTKATIEEVTRAVTQQTGVAVTFAEGALASVGSATLTLNAGNIPAHMLLIQSLSALDLAVHFDASGAQVQKLPEGAAKTRMRVFSHAPDGVHESHDGATTREHVVIVHGEPEGAGVREQIFVHMEPGAAADGATRMNVKFRGGPEGQAEGTLELQVHRDTTSTQR